MGSRVTECYVRLQTSHLTTTESVKNAIIRHTPELHMDFFGIPLAFKAQSTRRRDGQTRGKVGEHYILIYEPHPDSRCPRYIIKIFEVRLPADKPIATLSIPADEVLLLNKEYIYE